MDTAAPYRSCVHLEVGITLGLMIDLWDYGRLSTLNKSHWNVNQLGLSFSADISSTPDATLICYCQYGRSGLQTAQSAASGAESCGHVQFAMPFVIHTGGEGGGGRRRCTDVFHIPTLLAAYQNTAFPGVGVGAPAVSRAGSTAEQNPHPVLCV
jgi:hypothetical protein